MKKVKIMLSAIAVLAVVGGALAFNVKKTASYKLFTCNRAPVIDVCVKSDIQNTYTTVTLPQFTSTWTEATITNGSPNTAIDCTAGKCTATTTGTVE